MSWHHDSHTRHAIPSHHYFPWLSQQRNRDFSRSVVLNPQNLGEKWESQWRPFQPRQTSTLYTSLVSLLVQARFRAPSRYRGWHRWWETTRFVFVLGDVQHRGDIDWGWLGLGRPRRAKKEVCHVDTCWRIDDRSHECILASRGGSKEVYVVKWHLKTMPSSLLDPSRKLPIKPSPQSGSAAAATTSDARESFKPLESKLGP